MRKIAIFADVQNIYYTTRQAYGRQFNYRKMWQQVSEMGEIVCAKAYAIDKGDEQQKKFQSALRHIGFEVKLKPFIQRSDGSAKGDWDVGLVIDVLDAAPEVDAVVLLSGDGDFDLLLNKLNTAFDIETHVYGVPMLTADALLKSADEFHRIEEGLLL